MLFCTRVPTELDESWSVGKKIGAGPFSSVHLGASRDDQSVAVIKIFRTVAWLDGPHRRKERRQQERRVRSEVEILTTMSHAATHPNLIKMVQEVTTASRIYIVSPHYSGGDLFSALSRRLLSEPRAAQMVHDVSAALAHLHGTFRVVHRDVKPENLVFASERPVPCSLQRVEPTSPASAPAACGCTTAA